MRDLSVGMLLLVLDEGHGSVWVPENPESEQEVILRRTVREGLEILPREVGITRHLRSVVCRRISRQFDENVTWSVRICDDRTTNRVVYVSRELAEQVLRERGVLTEDVEVLAEVVIIEPLCPPLVEDLPQLHRIRVWILGGREFLGLVWSTCHCHD